MRKRGIGRLPRVVVAGVVLGLVVAALGACAALVGVGDVPVPDDGEAVNPNEGGSDATADALPDAMALDGTGPRPDADGATPIGPADAAPDAPVDVGTPEIIPDAAIGASCSSEWEVYDPTCNLCGQQHCCDELSACERVDDAGIAVTVKLLSGGMESLSFCAAYVYCVTGYRKSATPDMCQNMGHYSAAELALGNAALTCVRTSCPQTCDQL